MGRANSLSVSLPAEFVPISGMAWLQDGLQVVIGATYSTDGGFYVAESQARGNFFNASNTDIVAGNPLSVQDPTWLWTLEETGENFFIKHDEKYVAKGATETALQLTTNRSEAIPYSITQSDGTFVLRNTLDGDRYFSFTLTTIKGKLYYVFGNYKSGSGATLSLHLYRYGQATLSLHGQATMPDPGSTVCIFSNDKMLTADGTASATDYLLSNATLAASAPALQWQANVLSANTFSLLNAAGQYLDADLHATNTEVVWTLNDGTFWQGERALRYIPSSQHFATLTSEEAAAGTSQNVWLLPVTPQATQTISGGTLIISGGLSALELAELDWQGATWLDLTACPLPAHPQTFTERPEGQNTLIIVNPDDARFVPNTWDFVVTKDATYTLLTPATLTDRVALRLPADISISAGQVRYVRRLVGDGNWETLSLPFAALAGAEVEVEAVSETDDEAVYFSPVTTISAGQGIIFRPRDNAATEVTFVALNGTLTTATTPPLQGYYETHTITSSSASPLFLLNNDGTYFVRAATGSRLAPFRAALHTTTMHTIRHKNTP